MSVRFSLVVVLFVSACAADIPPGVEGFLDTQRAAADQVCQCASTLGMSVSSCLDRFDSATFEEASMHDAGALDCLTEALAVDPDAEAVLECYAEASARLADCAAGSGCDAVGLQRCLDRQDLDRARCPVVSAAFHDTHRRCSLGLEVMADPLSPYLTSVTHYLRVVSDNLTIGLDWQGCVRPYLETNVHGFDQHAACAVPLYRDLSDCIREDHPTCSVSIEDIDACPPMHPDLEAAIAHCWPAL